MGRAASNRTRLRRAGMACFGAVAGLGLGLIAARALAPGTVCPAGEVSCSLGSVQVLRPRSGNLVRAPVIPTLAGPDAGVAGSDVDSPAAVPTCASPGSQVAFVLARPQGELAAAREMLLGASEIFGLDYDAADALSCGDRSATVAPRGCSLPAGEPVRVGGFTFCTGLYTSGHEWDGMYSHNEVVVLARWSESGLRAVHAVPQWMQNVPDCYTELLHQRYAVHDLDGDGVTELCVESIREVGEGLFEVMEATRWHPQRRERTLRAYRAHPTQGRLLRAEGLDARCPRSGYRPFVEHESVGDSVSWRARVQGGRLCPAHCARPLRDACGNVHFSVDSSRAVRR